MIDFFMDVSNIPTEYTIYVTFLLGLMVKFLWVWNIEYHFYDSLNKTSELDSSANTPHQQLRYYILENPLLVWMTKCIRKKDGSGDDSDSINSFL